MFQKRTKSEFSRIQVFCAVNPDSFPGKLSAFYLTTLPRFGLFKHNDYLLCSSDSTSEHASAHYDGAAPAAVAAATVPELASAWCPHSTTPGPHGSTTTGEQHVEFILNVAKV